MPMPPWPDYELIDFGRDNRGVGRKLERFGQRTFDRPCPAAADAAPAVRVWRADLRYSGSRGGDGKWRRPAAGTARTATGGATTIRVPLPGGGVFRLRVEPTPAGQLGLFPEQFTHWGRIAQWAADTPRPARVLNLFAYTGASTLAAAGGGAEVTHVDASRPAVALARQNAQASGLADAPIRWIVEDALKYCRREATRGARYDAVVLDPPTFGHGPAGEQWRLSRDLPTLLDLVGALTDRCPALLVASCHTPGIGPAELGAYLADGVLGRCGHPAATGSLWLATHGGRRLPSGVYARWPR